MIMKHLCFALAAAAVLTTVSVTLAASPDTTASRQASSAKSVSPGEVPMTPEIWFYQQQMQQYLDPKMAVRRNAEARADQRSRRVATMKWFGMSNSRPRANVDPIHQAYSPSWVSNNDWYPDRWAGMYGH
jgi:hypothetical protein